MTEANQNPQAQAAQVFKSTPEAYEPMTGQEAQAAAIVAKSQVFTNSVESYDGNLQGTEAAAKQIVDAAREANNQTAPAPAASGESVLDMDATADAGAALNDMAPAAGQPWNGSSNGLNTIGGNGLATRSSIAHEINKPAAGQTAVIDVQPGELLQAKFDPNAAELQIQGKDLALSFNDGSKIILHDFAADAQNLPTIALQDGSIVAGNVIIAQLQGLHNDLFNLETAAGASGEGGTFIYNDDLGNVIGLLNKLPPIPFTDLQFGQPDPEVTINDDFGGVAFGANSVLINEALLTVPGTDTVNGSINVSFANAPAGNNVQLSLDGLAGLGLTSHGVPLVFTLSPDGHTITATANGVDVFTLQLGSPTNVGTEYNYGYTFTQLQPLDHIPGGGTNLENIPVNFVVYNNAGVGTGGTFNIGVVDDVPVAAWHEKTRDETNQLGQPVGSSFFVGPAWEPQAHWGADGPGQAQASNQFAATTRIITDESAFDPANANAFPSLKSHGVDVVVTMVNGNYVGMAGNVKVFEFIIDNSTPGDPKWSFTLFQPLDHYDPTRTNEPIMLNFGFGLVDYDGDVSNSHITVCCFDDAPTAFVDVATIPDGSSVAVGNVIANDTLSQDFEHSLKDVTVGGTTRSFALPDGIDGGGKYILLQGQYGVLKIYENGNYTYTYDNAHFTGTHVENFGYTLQDFDGDTSASTLTITIYDDPMIAPEMICVAVWEVWGSNELHGAAVVQDAVSYHLGGIDGAGSFLPTGNMLGGQLMSHGVPVVVTFVNGQFIGMAGDTPVFTLTMGANGQYDFVLHQSLDHSGWNAYFDIIDLHFNYTAIAADGDAVEGVIQIRVNDYGPQGAHDWVYATVDQATAAGTELTGNVLANDGQSTMEPGDHLVWGLNCITYGYGPFGPGVGWDHPSGTDAGGPYLLVEGVYGFLKMYQNGDYTYTLKPFAQECCIGIVREEFYFDIGDSDTDVHEQHIYFEINVQNGTVAPVISLFVPEMTGMDQDFTGQITVPGATNIAAGDEHGDSHFHVTGPLMNNTLSHHGVPITVSLVNGNYIGMAGNLEVFRMTLNPDGTYHFVLKESLDHGVSWIDNEIISLYFGYSVTMPDGSVIESCIQVRVEDGILASGGHFYYVNMANPVVTGNAMDEIHAISPDGFMGFHGVVPYQGGPAVWFSTPAGHDELGDYVIAQGLYGYLKMYASGHYIYTLTTMGDPCDGCSKTDMFYTTSSDYDGDYETTNVLYFNIDYNAQGVQVSPGSATNLIIDNDHTMGLLPDVHLDNTNNLSEVLINIKGTHMTGYYYETFQFDTAHTGYSIENTNQIFHNGVYTGLNLLLGGGPWYPEHGWDLRIVGNASAQTYQDIIQALNMNTLSEQAEGGRLITLNITDEFGHTTTQTNVMQFHSYGSGNVAHTDIPVFHAGDHNSIDLSDLLAGSGYHAGTSDVNDFVRIDHATGHVMVDITGTGTFDPTHYVATVDNTNAYNQINIILNDEEGSRLVHTV